MVDFDGIAYVVHTTESGSIDYNNGTITTARLTATIASTDVYIVTYYLTADGVNWEQVSNGLTHTFINTGKDLRYRIIGEGGFIITKIVIDNYH